MTDAVRKVMLEIGRQYNNEPNKDISVRCVIDGKVYWLPVKDCVALYRTEGE